MGIIKFYFKFMKLFNVLGFAASVSAAITDGT